jgi:hypothetical protein
VVFYRWKPVEAKPVCQKITMINKELEAPDERMWLRGAGLIKRGLG